MQQGAELESELYIVTEPVQPLADWLADQERELQHAEEAASGASDRVTAGIAEGQRRARMQAAITWGIHSLVRALKFLNEDCKLLHGNVTTHAVFVTEARHACRRRWRWHWH